jgi:Rne/Rng family ribonuclease
VLLGGASGVRLSRRLASGAEGVRLAKLLTPETGEDFGLIVREFAASAPDHVLLAESRQLAARWRQIEQAARQDAAPRIIAEPASPPLAFLRELIDARVVRVIAGDAESFELASRAKEEAGEGFPDVEMHRGPLPAFDAYGLGAAIDSALRRSVTLPGGGVLLIDRGAAGTTIDVDSATYTAGPAATRMLELNLEAAAEVARQLRLRNESGLVLVDFVDLPRPADRERVDGLLRGLLALDPCYSRALALSEFSVAQITRQRRGAPLSELLLVPCRACGVGRELSPPAEARRLLRGLRRLAWPKPGGRFRLCARGDVLDQARRIAREEGARSGLPAVDRVSFVEADPAVAEE